MKQLIFTLGLIALISCKDKKQQEILRQQETTHEHHQNNAVTVYNNDWMADMQLNDDAKWQANEETNEGVLKMQDVLKTQSTATVEEYHKLAEQLHEAKKYVIKECTMEGPSHDYLHVWLLPLIEKLDALSETETIEEASKIMKSIEENVNAYNTYFQ